MRRNLTLLLFTSFLCTTLNVLAQAPVNPDSALQGILAGMKGTPLTLQQATQLGMSNATSLRKAEAAYLAATGSVRRESGSFDPELFFDLNYVDQKQPAASFFSGGSLLLTQQTSSRTGVRMNLPIGTELELSLNTVKLQTNSQFAFLNPEYDAFGSLSLRQSLLGGFSTSARKQLTRTEQELEASKARYDQQALAVQSDVERAYWDLYAAERDYAVQQLTRDRAEAFLKETELRAQSGLIGPNQVANARTFLAEQELLLLERQEQLDRQSDQIASFIGTRPDAGAPRFLAVDGPPSDFPLVPVDALVEHARKSNLDLKAAQQDVEATRTLADAAGWEALPKVDLIGSLGGSGLSGYPRNVIFGDDTLRTTREGSFADAISQVSKREFPNWKIGVEVSIPIGFRSGLGEKDRLAAQVLAAEQHVVEQSRALEEQIRSTYRELMNGKGRLKAAREGVEAAQEQVRIGLIEFHSGRSTAFELVRLGADFAAAQQRYSGAMVRTAKAAAMLRQLTSGGYPALTTH